MKRIYLCSLSISCALWLLCLTMPVVLAQRPVRVQINTMGRDYPGLLSDFNRLAEQTIVQVTNTVNCNVRVESIEGSLLRINGIGRVGIQTKGRIALSDFRNLPNFIGGSDRPITGSELAQLFNINDFDFFGFSPSITDGSLRLPAGTYRFCVSVYGTVTGTGNNCGTFDPNQPLNDPNLGTNCATVNIENYNAPQLMLVNAGAGIPPGGTGGVLPLPPTLQNAGYPNLAIQWQPVTGSRGQVSGLQYEVFIAEIPENYTNDPNTLFNSLTNPVVADDARWFIHTTVPAGTNTLTLNNSNIPPEGFRLGYRYIVGVRAMSLNSVQPLDIPNNGFSPIYVFTYGQAPSTVAAAPLTLSAYPPDGVYMPFRGMPIIVKYEPYSDTYRSFESTLSLSNQLSSPGNRSTALYSNFARSPLSWPNGPLRAQQRVLNDAALTRLAAQHIIISPGADNSLYSHHDFGGRGIRHNWTADVQIGLGTSNPPLQETIVGSFTAGMGPPQLITPADNATISSGYSVSLVFKTSQIPALPLLPPVEVSQARNGNMTLFPVFIREKWVLEVSRDQSFSALVTTRTSTLNQTYNLGDPWSRVAADIYKDITEPVSVTETGTYYWRVKWMVQPDGPSQNAYSFSEVRRFNIGTVVPTPSPTDCLSSCIVAVRGGTESLEIVQNERITVGLFTLLVETVSGGSTSAGYNGSGRITNFRDENTNSAWPAEVQVTFTNLRKNELNIAHAGEVNATGGGPVSTVLDLLVAAGQGLADVLGLGGVSGGPLRVPLGFNESMGGHRIALVLKTIKFTPTRAFASIEVGYDMNLGEVAGHPLVFEASEVCLKPGGFGDSFKLGLARDVVIGDTTQRETKYAVYLSGASAVASSTVISSTAVGQPQANRTELSWTCKGFEYLQLVGKVVFPRSHLIPETEAGERSTNARDLVEGRFNVRLDRNMEDHFGFITDITLNKTFQFTGLPGFGFTVDRASFDLSDGVNPAGMQFPAGYDFTKLGASEEDVNSARFRDTWTGFYLGELTVKLPKTLTGDNRIPITLSNVLIDRSGFSAALIGKNILTNSSNFGLSIDTLGLRILQNASVSGFMSGSIALPIFDPNDKLKYSTALTFADGNLNYNFLLQPKGEGESLHMSLWEARVSLKNNSSIEFKIGTNQKAQLKARLHGTIGIGESTTALGGINLDMTGIAFENFGFDTENPNFFTFSSVVQNGNSFSFVTSQASPQHSAGGFGLTISEVNVSPNSPPSSGARAGYLYPKLSFKTSINLSDALNGSLGLDIVGRLKITTSPSFSVSDIGLERIDLNDIEVALKVSGFELCGRVKFVRDDPRFGNGVYGQVCAKIPIGGDGLKAQFKCMFGNTAGNSGSAVSATNAQYYNYWYVDGSVTFPTGLPIFTGVALYGFGGGAYHHMSPTRPASSTATRPVAGSPSSTTCNCGGTAGSSAMADVIGYSPDRNTSFGIMASLVLGTSPTPDVFNMELKLEASFNDQGGLNQISFDGKGQLLASVNNPIASGSNSMKVAADVRMVFVNSNNPTFDFDVNVTVNILGILRGAGDGDTFVRTSLHVERTQWWFYMGEPEPSKRAGLTLGFDIGGQRVRAAELTSYLMVGHGIPTELPALPQAIQDIFNRAQPEHTLTNLVSSDTRTRQLPPTGTGFAFGSHFTADARLPFAIFYAQLSLGLGFDVNLTHSDTRKCGETNTAPGVNGWYAQGQMYASLVGKIGIHVDLFIVQGDFVILEVGAAIKMVAKLPNPEYFQGRAALYYNILNGAIQGNCNFNVEFGQKCTPVDPNPLSFPIIADLKPAEGEADVSVFTDVRASFNLKMNEGLEISELRDDGSTLVRTFMPRIKSFVLTQEDGTPVITTPAQLVGTGFEAVIYVTGDALKGRQPYRTKIDVALTETTNNTNTLAGEQSKAARFTTGDRPDNIPESQVAGAYPVQQQAYFLQNEGSGVVVGDAEFGDYRPGRTGFLQVRQMNYLFDPAQNPPNTQFRVRYTPESGQSTQPIDLPFRYDPDQAAIIYEIPPLANRINYRIEFIKRQFDPTTIRVGRPGSSNRPPVSSTTTTYVQSGTLTQQSGNRVVAGQTVGADGQIQNETFDAGQMQRRNNQLSGNSVREIPDKILYQYRFGTSRYNTFVEKIATFRITTVRSGPSTDLQYEVSEPFDQLEGTNRLMTVSFVAQGNRLPEINEQFRYLNALTNIWYRYRFVSREGSNFDRNSPYQLPTLYVPNRSLYRSDDVFRLLPEVPLNPYVSYTQTRRFRSGLANEENLAIYRLQLPSNRRAEDPIGYLTGPSVLSFGVNGLTPTLEPLPPLSSSTQPSAITPAWQSGGGERASALATAAQPVTTSGVQMARLSNRSISQLFASATISRIGQVTRPQQPLTLFGNVLTHYWQAGAMGIDGALRTDLMNILYYGAQDVETSSLSSPLMSNGVRWQRSNARGSLSYSLLTPGQQQEITGAFVYRSFPNAQGEYRLRFSYNLPTLRGAIVSSGATKSYQVN